MSELPGSGSIWNRFSLDPRAQGDFRASDRDRDVVRDVLHEAYAEGRIDKDELDERISHTLDARQLGQLVPLVDDVVLPEKPQPRRTRRPRSDKAVTRPNGSGRTGMDNAVIAVATVWVFVAAVTNVVWLLTSPGDYYWPIWPMFGVGVSVFALILIRFAIGLGRPHD